MIIDINNPQSKKFNGITKVTDPTIELHIINTVLSAIITNK